MAARFDLTSHNRGIPTVVGAGEDRASAEAGGEAVLTVGEGEAVVAAVVAIAVAVAVGAECGPAPSPLLKVERLPSNVALLRPYPQLCSTIYFNHRLVADKELRSDK